MIAELTGEHRFLSNFWSCFIEYQGDTYPSVENAYQAAKCDVVKDRDKFLHCKASEAKRLGRVICMKPNWNEERLGVMLQLLRQKFKSEPLRSKLLATGKQEIEEGNWWGDTYWGTVNGVGENHLGKLLMQVREELKNDKHS